MCVCIWGTHVSVKSEGRKRKLWGKAEFLIIYLLFLVLYLPYSWLIFNIPRKYRWGEWLFLCLLCMQYDSNQTNLIVHLLSLPMHWSIRYVILCLCLRNSVKKWRFLFCSQPCKQAAPMSADLGNGCGSVHLLTYTFIPNPLQRHHFWGSTLIYPAGSSKHSSEKILGFVAEGACWDSSDTVEVWKPGSARNVLAQDLKQEKAQAEAITLMEALLQNRC